MQMKMLLRWMKVGRTRIRPLAVDSFRASLAWLESLPESTTYARQARHRKPKKHAGRVALEETREKPHSPRQSQAGQPSHPKKTK